MSDAELRSALEQRLAAFRRRDAEASVAALADDVVVFDVVEPLRRMGKADVLVRAKAWLSGFRDGLVYELRDLVVSTHGALGATYALAHAAGTKTDGSSLSMWWRTTAIWHHRDGRWLVVHQHDSVPLDPETGKASVGLAP